MNEECMVQICSSEGHVVDVPKRRALEESVLVSDILSECEGDSQAIPVPFETSILTLWVDYLQSLDTFKLKHRECIQQFVRVYTFPRYARKYHDETFLKNLSVQQMFSLQALIHFLDCAELCDSIAIQIAQIISKNDIPNLQKLFDCPSTMHESIIKRTFVNHKWAVPEQDNWKHRFLISASAKKT